MLAVEQREVSLDLAHCKLVVKLAIAMGHFMSGWPRAADVRAANAADRRRFDQFEPIFHTL